MRHLTRIVLQDEWMLPGCCSLAWPCIAPDFQLYRYEIFPCQRQCISHVSDQAVTEVHLCGGALDTVFLLLPVPRCSHVPQGRSCALSGYRHPGHLGPPHQ